MISPIEQRALRRIRERFTSLYGDAADMCIERFDMLCGRYGVGYPRPAEPCRWTEKDAVLITYGDQVQAPGEKPLATLRRFLKDHVGAAFNSVHILPFYPSSSDDGFAVVHFRQVQPELGEWSNIKDLATDYRLMVDLVLNHVSRQSGWFLDLQAGVSPGQDYFVTADPKADLSEVVRPRAHPLLTPVPSRHGLQHVWTTFSEDQVDLNFANPDVLFEMLDLILFYVHMGARILRLDAIAYLWKRIGTPCIHLPETHEVVKLFRELLDLVSPDVWLLTETNVPHAENVSYFGSGDEAHMIYQFSLPPLILHALTTGNARFLSAWASDLRSPAAGCTFLNFTASHDGIGVRPLQGLIPDAELAALVNHVEKRGGQVSMKRNTDGSESPYELNIAWFDAMGAAQDESPELHLQRFVASLALAFVLQGIPAVYFHALTATPNHQDGVRQTGRARSINRRKWAEPELAALIRSPASSAARALSEIRRLLELRARHRAFHPDSPQRVLAIGDQLFAVARTAVDASEIMICITNCSRKRVEGVRLPPGEAARGSEAKDMVTGKSVNLARDLDLEPYQFMWISIPQEGAKPLKRGES